MTAYVASLLIGIIAGLRAMTAPAAASWAAYTGALALGDTWLAFLGYRWTPWILTALAAVELVTDQLPSTPSRKVPQQLGARVVTGAVSGAAFGSAGGSLIIGGIAGVVGALIGTYGGAEARARLAGMFRKDLPAALIEDAVAILGAVLIVMAVR